MTEEIDAGRPIAYQGLAVSTAVFDREGERIGSVEKVLMIEEEDVFDGLVIDTDGGTRFIDAAEVGHLAERRVDLNVSGAEVAQRPNHEYSAPTYDASIPSGRMQDLWRRFTLRRLWRRD
jgi:hypothetical protein